MNPLATQMLAFRAQAQTFTEGTLPAEIRLGDSPKVYEVSTGGFHTEEKLAQDGGGFVAVDVVSFRISKALCPAVPKSNWRIFWVDGNRELRLLRTATGGLTDPTWLLTCEAITE